MFSDLLKMLTKMSSIPHKMKKMQTLYGSFLVTRTIIEPAA